MIAGGGPDNIAVHLELGLARPRPGKGRVTKSRMGSLRSLERSRVSPRPTGLEDIAVSLPIS